MKAKKEILKEDKLPEENGRILQIINEDFGGNISGFAENIGLYQQVVDRLFKIDKRSGKYPRKLTHIYDGIEKHLPHYNINWIKTGIGDKEQVSNQSYTEQRRNKKNHTVDLKVRNSNLFQVNPMLTGPAKQGKVPVKFFDEDFQAGSGIVFYEDNVEFPAYEMNIPAFSGCIAFNVFGDSMEPLIKNGSVCFGRKLEDWRDYIEYGQIFGIVMKNNRRFLKFIRKSNDVTKFLLRSANHDYDDFEIPKEKIHNIWLIEGWMLKRT